MKRNAKRASPIYVYVRAYMCVYIFVCANIYIYIYIYIYLSYKEELLLCLSSYPLRWQKLLVGPEGAAFATLISETVAWLMADEDKVSHVFSHIVW